MPLRLHIVKGTGQGESITVDIPQWNPVSGEIEHTVDEMLAMADEALKLADMRQLQDQTRLMEAYNLDKECTPEEWSKIVSVLDIVNGTQTADLVKRRWQSAREETAELEASRAAAVNTEEEIFYKALASKGECTCSRFTAHVPCPQHEAVDND